MTEYRDFQEYVRESIRNPKDAAEYLNAAAEDGDSAAFLIALNDVAAGAAPGVIPLRCVAGRRAAMRGAAWRSDAQRCGAERREAISPSPVS